MKIKCVNTQILGVITDGPKSAAQNKYKLNQIWLLESIFSYTDITDITSIM